MLKKIIAILLLINVTVGLSSESLSSQLKNFKFKLAPEVKQLLDKYADQNQSLNSLEMQQAAYVASQVNEWTIAGFYYIARPMISGLSQKSFEYDSPLTSSEEKKLRKTWAKIDARLKPLRKNKSFKSLKKRDKNVDLVAYNHKIKLKLIHNKEILVAALRLYEQWQPKIDKDYHYIMPYTKKKSESEIVVLFKQLNEIYLKANENIVKLMQIPRYKELKLKFMDFMVGYSEMLNKGKQPDMNKMIKYAQIKNEMEQLEIDNLLFPEINWGNWF